MGLSGGLGGGGGDDDDDGVGRRGGEPGRRGSWGAESGGTAGEGSPSKFGVATAGWGEGEEAVSWKGRVPPGGDPFPPGARRVTRGRLPLQSRPRPS